MGRLTAYALDASVQRHGDVVIGGSPLKLFRLTPAGSRLVDRIAVGEPVPPSDLVGRLEAAGAIHPQPSAGPLTAGDVTVVVPTRGGRSAFPPGAVVVDDGAEPPVPGAAVRLDANQGVASARNAGLAVVETPLVAFVDDDVELTDGWLDPLVAHFADERVALVAPRVITTPAGGVPARLLAYERRRSPLDLGPEPARIAPGTRVGYVPAAAIVCRTAAVRDVGGFDPALRFGEDVDLVWRLVDAGWRCRYEPASVVHHPPRPSWPSWLRQRIGYGSSAAPLARRHPGKLAPLRMSAWSLAAWALVAARRPLLGASLGVASAAALVPKLPDVPPGVAFGLAANGNLRAGAQIADAVRRAWWPLAAVAALRSRTARRILLAAALAAGHPLRLADDLAYSVGVWKGILAERTPAPLIPEVVRFP